MEKTLTRPLSSGPCRHSKSASLLQMRSLTLTRAPCPDQSSQLLHGALPQGKGPCRRRPHPRMLSPTMPRDRCSHARKRAGRTPGPSRRGWAAPAARDYTPRLLQRVRRSFPSSRVPPPGSGAENQRIGGEGRDCTQSPPRCLRCRTTTRHPRPSRSSRGAKGRCSRTACCSGPR